jgi:hypothetical protein
VGRTEKASAGPGRVMRGPRVPKQTPEGPAYNRMLVDLWIPREAPAPESEGPPAERAD